MRKVGSIKANWDSGEGEAVLSEEFKSMDSLFRADILSDLIYDLTIEYDKAREDMLKEFDELREKKGK